MPTNYTLTGLNVSVEFGRSNARVVGISDTQLRTRDNANAADANMSGADAIASNDFVTLDQLNNATFGLSWKQYVQAASTADVTIAAPGATLDGVTLALNDRVLLKDQAAPITNGIYIFDTAATPLVRAADMATGSDATNAAMFVAEGTANGDTAWVETADPAIVDTDALTFTNFAITTGTVTSIASVDDGGGAGTFCTLVKSGSAPVPQIVSISNGSQIACIASGGTNQVDLSIVAASVTNTEMAANAIEEDNLAAGVAILFRYLQVLAAGFPVATGSNTVSLGSILPANSIVQGGKILVTTAFDLNPDLTVGTGSDPDSVFETTDLNLQAIDTYVSDRMSVLTASTQLIVTRTTGVAQPTVGVAEIMVNFARVA